ncbi:MAG: CotH kinase family protein, partial [Verrucomicrobia bacterium]|nr:CotH kinase family protein [Verrucomicrobiota bacterium]
TVDMAGWRLTDKPDNLSKWTFPSTNLAPAARMLVFASDRNRAIPGEELHTNFELSKDGEYLALVTPSGTVAHAFSPAYPPQVDDVSYGILPGGTTNILIQTNAACRFFVPVTNNQDGAWIWWGFDDSSWSNGTGALGFDTNTLYRSLIRTSVSNLMHNVRATVYVRIPFVVDKPTSVRSLQARIGIDDGFVLYLNGSEVARTNAGPNPPAWNSTAWAENVGTNPLTMPISRASKRLVQGTNWFCIQGLNRTTNNPDFYMQCALLAFTDSPTTGMTACTYFKPPSPGDPNDPTRAIRGPLISWATDTAIGIRTGVTMAVTARVSQTFFPVTTVTSHWRVMYGVESAVPMRDDGTGGDPVAGDGIFHGTIPATGLGTNQMIRWRYEARDVSNNVTRLPPFYDFADSPEYFGAVAVDPALVSNLPVFWWFCSSTSSAETELGARCSVYFMSNFYDNVGVDLHGQSSSGFPIKSHNFDFNSDAYFLYEEGRRRVQDIDVLSTWADKSKCRVTMSYGSFTAFGHPAHFAFPVRVHRNGPFHAISDMVEDADDRFLKRVGLSEDGALYKMYNNLSHTNVPASWWPAPPGAGASVTSGAEKKSRRDEGNDDLKALIFGLAVTQSVDRLTRFIYDNVDIPRAVNYFAVMAPTQDHDHHSKNYYLYRDSTGTLEWTLLPQDADLTFGHIFGVNGYFDPDIKTNSSFIRGGNRMYDTLFLSSMPFRKMIMRRTRTVIDRTLKHGQTFYQDWIGSLTDRMALDYADYRAKWSSTTWGPTQTVWETMSQEANRIVNIYLPGHWTYLNTISELPGSQPAYVPL